MADGATKKPKIFISYAWANKNTADFVLDLAQKLMQHGVDVLLDKWDLQEGQDKYAFMERSVTDETVTNVLLICDESYKERADNRNGGVGVETTVITPEIYGKVTQQKFLPILLERDEDGTEYLPAYLKSRIYIDFSSPDIYEESYEQLLRRLYDKPLYKKPATGQPPAWLDEDSVNYNELNILVKKTQNLAEGRPYKFQELKISFIEKFIEVLNDMRFTNDKFDSDSLLKKIDSLKPIRDLYFDFLMTTISSEYFSSDFVKDFFENIYNRVPTINQSSYNQNAFEYYNFLIWESFIGTIALLWKYEKYSVIYNLITQKYFLRDSLFINSEESPCSFTEFRKYFQIIEVDCQKNLDKKYSSYAAKLLSLRDKRPLLNQNAFAESDLRLYHLSTILLEPIGNFKNIWFPLMYCYAIKNKTIWQKLISKSYCEKNLPLFGVKTISELKSLFSNVNKKQIESIRGNCGFFDSVPTIFAYVKISDIATLD